MNIVFSKPAHHWLKRYRVCHKSLRNILKYLCYKEGYPTNKTLHIHIKHNGTNSDYDIGMNRITVGLDVYTKNKRQRVKRMIRNLLHELRHFIQYKIQKREVLFSYSQKDIMTMSDRYWYAPEEIDARKYELKKLKFVLKRIQKPKN